MKRLTSVLATDSPWARIRSIVRVQFALPVLVLGALTLLSISRPFAWLRYKYIVFAIANEPRSRLDVHEKKLINRVIDRLNQILDGSESISLHGDLTSVGATEVMVVPAQAASITGCGYGNALFDPSLNRIFLDRSLVLLPHARELMEQGWEDLVVLHEHYLAFVILHELGHSALHNRPCSHYASAISEHADPVSHDREIEADDYAFSVLEAYFEHIREAPEYDIDNDLLWLMDVDPATLDNSTYASLAIAEVIRLSAETLAWSDSPFAPDLSSKTHPAFVTRALRAYQRLDAIEDSLSPEIAAKFKFDARRLQDYKFPSGRSSGSLVSEKQVRDVHGSPYGLLVLLQDGSAYRVTTEYLESATRARYVAFVEDVGANMGNFGNARWILETGNGEPYGLTGDGRLLWPVPECRPVSKALRTNVEQVVELWKSPTTNNLVLLELSSMSEGAAPSGVSRIVLLADALVLAERSASTILSDISECSNRVCSFEIESVAATGIILTVQGLSEDLGVAILSPADLSLASFVPLHEPSAANRISERFVVIPSEDGPTMFRAQVVMNGADSESGIRLHELGESGETEGAKDIAISFSLAYLSSEERSHVLAQAHLGRIHPASEHTVFSLVSDSHYIVDNTSLQVIGALHPGNSALAIGSNGLVAGFIDGAYKVPWVLIASNDEELR